MSGLVERRNQKVFWQGRLTWSRLKLKIAPACEDCLLNAHAARGTTQRIPRARWRRRNVTHTDTGPQAVTTFLCDVHRQEWLDWAPGQMPLRGVG